jgi:hypothetical protein
MAHLVSGNDKFPDLGYDDDYRFYLITRRDASGDYRFAKKHGKRIRVHARNALRIVVSLLRNAFRALLTFLGPSWDGPVRKYRPERYYMRGPGPKWREKQYKGASAI